MSASAVSTPLIPVPQTDPIHRLTPRECEVLSLMAQGMSNREICAQLWISSKTLERHVREIFSKLELPADDEARHRRVCAVLAWLRSPLSRGRLYAAT